MEITLEMIKSLRERSGAGIMDCKRALADADGNEDKAMQLLLERGIASAGKKASRETSQGVVETYIHGGGRIGALVEVNCETDFVARTEEFKGLAREVAMQIAAMNPIVISEEEIPEGVDGLPNQLALLLQPYIRDGSKTIQQLVNEAIGKTGENIQIKRFARFELGG